MGTGEKRDTMGVSDTTNCMERRDRDQLFISSSSTRTRGHCMIQRRWLFTSNSLLNDWDARIKSPGETGQVLGKQLHQGLLNKPQPLQETPSGKQLEAGSIRRSSYHTCPSCCHCSLGTYLCPFLEMQQWQVGPFEPAQLWLGFTWQAQHSSNTRNDICIIVKETVLKILFIFR